MTSQDLVPQVANLTLTDANTEYTQEFPAGTKHWSMQCRTAVDVRFAFVTGKVAGSTAPYGTMKAGGSVSSPEKMTHTNATAIYLASGTAGAVVEFLYWI